MGLVPLVPSSRGGEWFELRAVVVDAHPSERHCLPVQAASVPLITDESCALNRKPYSGVKGANIGVAAVEPVGWEDRRRD